MPLQRCRDDNKPGWKWGKSGKCYTYSAGNKAAEKKARAEAMKQAAAIIISRERK